MQIQKTAIIGSGQIGTSIAMSAAAAHPRLEIVAYDDKAIEKPFLEALRVAGVQKDNVRFTVDPSEIRGADLVILATPVGNFREAIKAVAPYVNVGTIFTDVGSVKGLSQRRVRDALDEFIGAEVAYVPFHILNGNAGSGPTTASATVFKAPGVIVPGQAEPNIEEKVTDFWRSLGSTIYKMSADKHDAIFGTTSHLEHAAMFSLMNTGFIDEIIGQRGAVDPGNWVQAMTRITVAGPDMWADNFYDNREKILETARHLRNYILELSELAASGSSAFAAKIDDLHHYAQDKQSTRVVPFNKAITDGQDVRASAFAGLLSMAIAANVQRVEKDTGQSIAAVANPSVKDGLGPVAIDPSNVSSLINRYRKELVAMTGDFVASFDRTLALIERRDSAAVRGLVKDVSAKRNILPKAFATRSLQNDTSPRSAASLSA